MQTPQRSEEEGEEWGALGSLFEEGTSGTDSASADGNNSWLQSLPDDLHSEPSMAQQVDLLVRS